MVVNMSIEIKIDRVTVVNENHRLDQIISYLEKIMSFVDDLTAEVSDLVAKVAELETTSDSSLELIKALNAKIQAIADSGLGDPTLAAQALQSLKDLGNSVEAQSAEIHAAIVATPA